MDSRNQALTIITVALLIHAVIVQSARRKLTADQLLAVEQLQRLTFRNFVPVFPFLICAITADYFPLYRQLQFSIASWVAFGLFIINGWHIKKRILSARLPAAYASTYFRGICVLALGFIGGLVVLTTHGI